MLSSSQVDTNPFESVPNDPSRSATPIPSPNGSSVALPSQIPGPPPDDATVPTTAQSPDQPPITTTRPPSRSFSSAFVSSPLNPNAATTSPFSTTRTGPRGSVHLSRIASEDSQALGSQRGSMVLWRLVPIPVVDEQGVLLPPPALSADPRRSLSSEFSGESTWTLYSDSKYPSGPPTTVRGGLVPYAWDPTIDDDLNGPDEDDALHRPESVDKPPPVLNHRSVVNVGVLIVLVGGLLVLFIVYPVVTFINDTSNLLFLEEESAANANTDVPQSGPRARSFIDPDTPQSAFVPQSDLDTRPLIDPDTPQSALSRVGYDGLNYNLVFSDEFNLDGRTFTAGDDPFWEAVNLWNTGDLERYDDAQVYTANGSLHVRIDDDPSSGIPYRSGMLQSWNKFCFTSGYIEVSLTLPGPNQETRGYLPGVRTMGNLARPGYGATTDGMWPFSYDACDVGTLPNQTWTNGTGPVAALYSAASEAKYDYSLSYQPGQRLSACTCPGEDHPGPSPNKGRGAPEIDVLKAEHNKQGLGGVISQSAQFAPFTHDYLYTTDTDQDWKVYDSSISRSDTYRGDAVQQAVSGITQLPPDVFEGPRQVFHTFGFEYFANPKSRSDGYIIWDMDNKPTVRMGAGAVGPDRGPGGSGVDQRLISEEPMSIVFNIGVSPDSQTIDVSTMTFSAEMLVDYVRVYQREDQINVGCDPPDYPTANYINSHHAAYNNPQLQSWTSGPAGANYALPKSSLLGGC